jgi:hypothetical protein
VLNVDGGQVWLTSDPCAFQALSGCSFMPAIFLSPFNGFPSSHAFHAQHDTPVLFALTCSSVFSYLALLEK